MMDVEIEIRRDEGYRVALRISEQRGEHGAAALDLAALQRAPDAAAYGRLLAQQLFQAPNVREAWTSARNRLSQRPIRVRVIVDRTASELHAIRWEALRDPVDDTWLLAGDDVYFSRFLYTPSGRSARLEPKRALRAVAFVGAGADAAREEQRARATLPGPAESLRVVTGSLDALIEAIGTDCDICYLACAGASRAGRTAASLTLDEPVAIDDLAARLARLAHPPAIVVLASQEHDDSVGPAEGLASLGPRLIEAGILVVLAMQGAISGKSAADYMKVLFAQLVAHGEVDRAAAVARGRLPDGDGATPVLFSRLRKDAIWYTPGLAGGASWNRILGSADSPDEPLLPIVGPGLLERMLGSPQELAEEFASTAWRAIPADWNDLPRLAQHRETTDLESRGRLVKELVTMLGRRVDRNLGRTTPSANVPSALAEAWRRERDGDPFEPHWFISSLRVPIFVTTNIDDSLAEALRARGRDPVVELFRWKDEMDLGPNGEKNLSRFQRKDNVPAEVPTIERPQVLHLFGHIRDPRSLVITEDDFFDFLMWANHPDNMTAASHAWLTRPLFLLGFRVEDWRFRVMFRSLFGNRRSRPLWSSVAAQIVPEVGGVLPMRDYLERHLTRASINTYWGSVEDVVIDFDRAMTLESIPRWTNVAPLPNRPPRPLNPDRLNALHALLVRSFQLVSGSAIDLLLVRVPPEVRGEAPLGGDTANARLLLILNWLNGLPPSDEGRSHLAVALSSIRLRSTASAGIAQLNGFIEEIFGNRTPVPGVAAAAL